jgi:hypothetical protein
MVEKKVRELKMYQILALTHLTPSLHPSPPLQPRTYLRNPLKAAAVPP